MERNELIDKLRGIARMSNLSKASCQNIEEAADLIEKDGLNCEAQSYQAYSAAAKIADLAD